MIPNDHQNQPANAPTPGNFEDDNNLPCTDRVPTVSGLCPCCGDYLIDRIVYDGENLTGIIYNCRSCDFESDMLYE
jgi:predicted RNA-binding Zn-ribbon protein involved in translation (DUF1610 family)